MRALSSVLLCALFCWSAVAVSRVASESDSDTDFLSDRQAQELDSIRQESELHANGEDQFMEPSYDDKYVKAHEAARQAKEMLQSSVLETKAELLSGLKRRPSPTKVARQVTRQDATPRFAEVRSKTTARSAQVDHSAIRDRIRAGRMNKQGQRIGAGLHGSSPLSKAQKLEGCMACRLVWRQVEMDVANARYVEDVESSFEHNCLDAQKSLIFYKACQDMQDDLYAMVDDYMSAEYTVDRMCQRAKFCA